MEPELYCRGESEILEVLWAAVVSCCDTPRVFTAAEHDPDPVAPLVTPLVVSHNRSSGRVAWDTGIFRLSSEAFRS